MKVLIDTCIIIDVLQKREPFVDDSKDIFLLCSQQLFDGFISAKAMTDIYYLMHRYTHDDGTTRTKLTSLCVLFNLLVTTKADVVNALISDAFDYEDAVMIETALRNNIDCIVTRNANDYKNSKIKIYEPIDFFRLFKVLNDLG